MFAFRYGWDECSSSGWAACSILWQQLDVRKLGHQQIATTNWLHHWQIVVTGTAAAFTNRPYYFEFELNSQHTHFPRTLRSLHNIIAVTSSSANALQTSSLVRPFVAKGYLVVCTCGHNNSWIGSVHNSRYSSDNNNNRNNNNNKSTNS